MKHKVGWLQAHTLPPPCHQLTPSAAIDGNESWQWRLTDSNRTIRWVKAFRHLSHPTSASLFFLSQSPRLPFQLLHIITMVTNVAIGKLSKRLYVKPLAIFTIALETETGVGSWQGSSACRARKVAQYLAKEWSGWKSVRVWGWKMS